MTPAERAVLIPDARAGPAGEVHVRKTNSVEKRGADMNRQRIRYSMIFILFLLFPAIFYYMSPYIIIIIKWILWVPWIVTIVLLAIKNKGYSTIEIAYKTMYSQCHYAQRTAQ